MRANAQRDGRHAEYRWRCLLVCCLPSVERCSLAGAHYKSAVQ